MPSNARIKQTPVSFQIPIPDSMFPCYQKKKGSSPQIIGNPLLDDPKMTSDCYYEISYLPPDLFILDSPSTIYNTLIGLLNRKALGNPTSDLHELLSPRNNLISSLLEEVGNEASRAISTHINSYSSLSLLQFQRDEKRKSILLSLFSILRQNRVFVDEAYLQLIKYTNTPIYSKQIGHVWDIFIFLITFFRSSRFWRLIRSYLFIVLRYEFIDVRIRKKAFICTIRAGINETLEYSQSNEEALRIKTIDTNLFCVPLQEVLFKESIMGFNNQTNVPMLIRNIIEKSRALNNKNLIYDAILQKNNLEIVTELPFVFEFIRNLFVPFLSLDIMVELDTKTPSFKCLEIVNELNNCERDFLFYLIVFLKEIKSEKKEYDKVLDKIACAMFQVDAISDDQQKSITRFITILIEYWDVNNLCQI